jgi:phosphatidylserine synthase
MTMPLHALAEDVYVNADAMHWLQHVMSSWPAQALIVVLYLGLAALAYARVSREWQDVGGARNRYFLGTLIVLGVLVIVQFVLGSSLLGVVRWPTWLYLIEYVVLFTLFFYYVVRLLTRQRSGRGDDETRRRGAALEDVIAPKSDQAHHTTSA